MRFGAATLLVISVWIGAGCGARSALDRTIDARVEHPPTPLVEVCNQLDDDLDGAVDEPFRDEDGHYVDDDHCGGCGRPCAPSQRPVVEAHCAMHDGAPACMATRCSRGNVVTSAGRCAPAFAHLCLPCTNDDDCGDVLGARCLDLAGERRCGEPCVEGACPEGYTCDASDVCRPSGNSCSCGARDHFDIACALTDPVGRVCAGSARCDDGALTTCAPPTEACNELDDDCDGKVDETYRDARGAYSVDVHNCGLCGVDCTDNPIPVGALACGGDAFAPSCVLDCVDTHDGVQPGDHVDGDRDIATGCECTVRSTTDDAGPVGASGEALDVNCDGADGIVVSSIYVATDGSDDAIGSPTHPMKTIGAAVERALASLTTTSTRPHVFVATGTYTEVLSIPSGVSVHGGYRRDFLALDPSGFVSEVRAPSNASNGGYVLTLRGTISAPTSIDWFRLIGADASAAGSAAIGVYLPGGNSLVSVRGCEIRAGAASVGVDGMRGASGSNPLSAPAEGAEPRAAIESTTHACVVGASNVVAGGAGGSSVCRGIDVSGGAGGSSHCPRFAMFAPDGTTGRAPPGRFGGSGGHGGQDSQAPISGNACPNAPVCCGLADFSVPSEFVTPGPGGNGQSGSAGASGRGCMDPLGTFSGTTWFPASATSGTRGDAGSGGGGGGAGGGTEFTYYPGLCPFADGLGGGGGGGGGGGCGGDPGTAATSGGPSIALLISFTNATPNGLPNLEGTRFITHDGGRGGDGGAGGAGGVGGTGAIGDEIPRAMRTTPSLAGPFPGGRGGRGGDGGAGGAGGGGCGGASIGVYVTGLSSSEPPIAALWRANNLFNLGRGGAAGRGGGASSSAGLPGGANDVLFR